MLWIKIDFSVIFILSKGADPALHNQLNVLLFNNIVIHRNVYVYQWIVVQIPAIIYAILSMRIGYSTTTISTTGIWMSKHGQHFHSTNRRALVPLQNELMDDETPRI